MKISVIVPAYNYGHFLPDIFNCLVAQTFSNWECLIIDNGSTDSTQVIVNGFTEKDKRFKYFRVSKQNPSAARNEGIKQANGKYIQFLDADDIISHDKFEKQLKAFSENDTIDLIYGDYVLTDEKLKNQIVPKMKMALSDSPFSDFISRWENNLTIPIHSFLIRMECFTKWGMMDESITTHEDWELQLKFSLNGSRYLYQPDLVAYYRIHKSSSSRNDRTGNRHDTLYVLMKYVYDDRVNLIQRLKIFTRYVEFVGEILLDKIRQKKIIVFKAISFSDRFVLNLISFLLFPFYLIFKIVRKIFVR